MTTQTSVTWGGVTIAGFSQSSFRLRELKGWVETPPPSFDDVSNFGVGSRVTPVSYGRRTVVVTGWCYDAGQRDVLLQQLLAAMRPVPGVVGTHVLSVSHAGLTLSADAQLTRASALPEQGWALGYFSFAIEWTCPDPLKYGSSVYLSANITGSSSSITFPVTPPWVFAAAPPSGQLIPHNEGTADAPAVYSLNGPLTSPGLDVGGRRVTFGFNLGVGDSLVIDSAAGAAFLNSAYRAPAARSALVSDLVLSPGDTTVQALGDVGVGGTPWVTASFSPAYW